MPSNRVEYAYAGWRAGPPRPFAWAVVLTAQQCHLRDGVKCTADGEHLNKSGMCTHEACPFSLTSECRECDERRAKPTPDAPALVEGDALQGRR